MADGWPGAKAMGIERPPKGYFDDKKKEGDKVPGTAKAVKAAKGAPKKTAPSSPSPKKAASKKTSSSSGGTPSGNPSSKANPPAQSPTSTVSKTTGNSGGGGGSAMSTGGGFLLGLAFWAWVALPFLKNGPSGVKNTLKAKFLNKAPDGSFLP